MEQRRTPSTATNVAAVLDASGATLTTLAEATDMDGSTLRDRMTNKSAFTFDELTRIGGLFRVRPANLIAGA